MNVTLATNATRPLNSYTPDRFLISIDGLEETHDRLRGAGVFARLLENLPGAKPPRIALVSLSRENVAEAEKILEFFTGKIEGFWFSFVYDYKGREQLALDAKEKKQAGQMLLELKNRFPIINKSSYLKRLTCSRPCRDWLLATVTADGNIHTGCMISALETCRCEECELACHREFSDFLEPRYFFSYLFDYLLEIHKTRVVTLIPG
jgi:sulfatase maturation enzyme AslB (radical SAM superfamily)